MQPVGVGNLWTGDVIERGAPRSVGKTVLIAVLLCFVPVVGFSMATAYWLTRHEPARYDAGAAARAGAALAALFFLAVLVGSILVQLLVPSV